MYVQRKIHSGLVGSLLLAAVAILFFFHTLPAAKRITELKRHAGTLQSKVAELSGETVSGTSAVSEIEKKELAGAIPETIEQDVLVLNFKQMATAADISFNALTFTKREGGTLPSVTISGGFTGTSANIIRFLKMIEVNPRKLVIRDAGVSRSETVGGLELVSLNLTIEAFFRSQS